MGFEGLSSVEHMMVKRLSNTYIAVSEAVEHYLVEGQGFSQEQIHTIRAGINLEKFPLEGGGDALRHSLGIDDCAVIGTAGRITHMKGSDLFLELAALLKISVSAGKKLKFLVLGTTEDHEFYKNYLGMLGRLGLAGDVVFLENIQSVGDYFGAMDIYVSTAREDPFPLVVMEAMACKKPVVAFAVGGIPEIITKECGILIDSLDVRRMSDAVLKLIYDGDQRLARGRAARTRVEQEFNLSKNIKAIERVIDSQMISRRG